MRVSYDKVGSRYIYPLCEREVRVIMNHVPPIALDLITWIRFGCNLRTTQEGRVVKRGKFYEIKVNFCLWDREGDMQSRLLSAGRKSYLEQVRRYGGIPDAEMKAIKWDLANAKRYASFVLLHEVGHVIHGEKYLHGQMGRKRSSRREENWCDDFSAQLVRRIPLGN
jgi:hypothetical protein